MDWNLTAGVRSDELEVEPAAPTDGRPYEAPALTILGTVSTLTEGVVPTSTDGVGPGSTL